MRARARIIVGTPPVLTPPLRQRWPPSLRSGFSIQLRPGAICGARRTLGDVRPGGQGSYTCRESRIGFRFAGTFRAPSLGLELSPLMSLEVLGLVSEREDMERRRR